MFARTHRVLLSASILALWTTSANAQPGDTTVVAATEVLKELVNLPDHGIPASLLAEAYGVAIIPNTIKVGLVIGGQHGKGVIVVREQNGNWRAPTFITMTGGSVGFQVGAQGSDIVLVFKTQKSVEGLMRGKFKIGADAAATAGPVGRRVEAATDAQLKAEIFSYSRSRGLFAGVALDGSVIQVDGPANTAYYGNPQQGQVVPAAALALTNLVVQLAAGQPVAPPAAVPAPAPVPGAVTVDAPLSPAAPSADANQLRKQLAQAAIQLNSRLDPAWQQYLALPAEVYREGNHAPLPGIKTAQSRFDSIVTDPRYSTLAKLPEFQTTRNLLQAYAAALSPVTEAKLKLPPPPGNAAR